jgi:hypothetical protein
MRVAVDREFRSTIYAADKHARQKRYNCLFPGCTRKAIACHSIPRASLSEALAERGKLFTLRQSFNPIMKNIDPGEPMEIAEIGVNQARLFFGYCPQHDSKFDSAEMIRKHGVIPPFHFRAYSLEYCRKRRNADYFRKLAELTTGTTLGDYVRELSDSWHAQFLHFGNSFLRMMKYVSMGFTSAVPKIESFGVPFNRNLELSCCGVFTASALTHDSVVAYNLISFSDMSILYLTCDQPAKPYMDSYLKQCGANFQQLVNDVAFMKCEEPLIGARLWRSLNEAEKEQVGLALCHPSVRKLTSAPLVIKIEPKDHFHDVTPELLKRLALTGR